MPLSKADNTDRIPHVTTNPFVNALTEALRSCTSAGRSRISRMHTEPPILGWSRIVRVFRRLETSESPLGSAYPRDGLLERQSRCIIPAIPPIQTPKTGYGHI